MDFTNGDPLAGLTLNYDGGAGGDDVLSVIGAGGIGSYMPAVTIGDGVVQVGGSTINFTGLEPVLVSGFNEFTFVTPNSNDVLTVDSPGAGQNRVLGTSGGVAFEALTFTNVANFKIDTATNDNPLANPNDTVNFSSDLVANGLTSFTIETGAGNDTVNASAITATGRCGVTVLGGDGDDEFWGGSRNDRIEGGPGNDSFHSNLGNDILFGGDGADVFYLTTTDDPYTSIDGGAGDDLAVVEASSGDDTLTLYRQVGQTGMEISNGPAVPLLFTDIEHLRVETGPGTDNITVNDLTGSGVMDLVLKTIEDDDQEVDDVTLYTPAADSNVLITEEYGNRIIITGLGVVVRIDPSYGAEDTLTVVGNAGNDSIKAVPGTEAVMPITLDGGAGDDYLSADAVLIGGAGNDILEGGAGDDTLNGGDGDDTFIGNGGTDTVTGGSGFDTILVAGTPGSDTISVVEAAGVHTVTVNGAVTAYATGSTFERILVDAGDGDDTVTISGAVTGLVVEAGAGNDVVDASAATTAVTLYGGMGDDDLTASAGGGLLDGGEGDDELRVTGGLTGTLLVSGGNPSASDVLFLTGAAATVENVRIIPNSANPTQQNVTGLGALITVSGVEVIRYTGAGDDDKLTVDTGPQDNTVKINGSIAPGGVDQVQSDSLPMIQFAGLDTFVLDPGSGMDVVTFVTAGLGGAKPANYQMDSGYADVLIIQGQDGAGSKDDSYLVTKPVVGSVAILDGNSAIVGVTVTETTGALARLEIDTLGGDDLVAVDVSSGLIRVPLTYDGGANSDTLLVVGDPAVAEGNDLDQVEYMPGPDVLEGRLLYDLDWTTPTTHEMTIDFINLEPVVDLTVANVAVTVYGTDADNAINFIEGPHSGLLDPVFNPAGATTGLVSVDAYETFEFANKNDVLEIISLAGDDVVNLNYQNATPPADLDRIWVEGNDPTGSDTVIVNGTTGPDTITVDQFTATGARVTGAQPIPVTITTAELLSINGQGGDDNLAITTPTGGHLIVFGRRAAGRCRKHRNPYIRRRGAAADGLFPTRFRWHADLRRRRRRTG